MSQVESSPLLSLSQEERDRKELEIYSPAFS